MLCTHQFTRDSQTTCVLNESLFVSHSIRNDVKHYNFSFRGLIFFKELCMS